MPITDLQTRAYVIAKGLDPDQWDIVDETPAASTEQQPQQYGGWETAGKVLKRSAIPGLVGAGLALGTSALFPPSAPVLLPLAAGGVTGALGALGTSFAQEKAIQALNIPEDYARDIGELQEMHKQHQ